METQSDAEAGFVYVLGATDIELPLCKIGRTARDPAVRCAEINQSSTGDLVWAVRHQIAVNDCRKFESLIHEKLTAIRQRRRELFNLPPDEAIVQIRSMLEMESALSEITVPGIPPVASRPRARQQVPRSRNDLAFAHLLDGFTELLNVKGRPFGQLNKPAFGISDGREGVQWNLVIYPKDEKARFGVNLEGVAYRGWPIARLIKAELEAPELPQLVPRLRDPQKITLRFARDAWQASSRPNIVEEYLGGGEFPLSELTGDLWRTILTEALGCLDKHRDHLGRSQQNVTLARKAGADPDSRTMWVSPHLTIWTPINPTRDSNDELSAAIEVLRPIHEWASKASET